MESQQKVVAGVGSEPPVKRTKTNEVKDTLSTNPKKTTHSHIQVSRRMPNRPMTTKTDIYITSSRSDAPLHKRIYKLMFAENEPCVTLHGLGTKCIFKSIKIASDFAEKYKPHIKTVTTTSTQIVTDDCVVRNTPQY